VIKRKTARVLQELQSNTSKTLRWETDARRCHVNWVVLDSEWEAEFCRVAESHPRVRAYVKNHNLGLEVPYRFGSESRQYRPDFVLLVDDGRGDQDPLHLVVETKVPFVSCTSRLYLTTG
jgi:type III restriction enzyme